MKKRVNYDFERRKKEQDRQRKKEAKLQRKQQANATPDDAEAGDMADSPAENDAAGTSVQ